MKQAVVGMLVNAFLKAELDKDGVTSNHIAPVSAPFYLLFERNLPLGDRSPGSMHAPTILMLKVSLSHSYLSN